MAGNVIDAGENVPVMVWIHGGAFESGSGTYGDYGPQYFMDRGVVVVTVNYRLGPFGFLTTTTEEMPGNLGLWDQALALHWVQDNIHHFGGDRDQVTLFGESAGSERSVNHHLNKIKYKMLSIVYFLVHLCICYHHLHEVLY